MKLDAYVSFVQRSDNKLSYNEEEKVRVARFGIASEIGSLVSAVKKISTQKSQNNTHPISIAPNQKTEISEELGDVLWYVTWLSILTGHENIGNVLALDFLITREQLANDTLIRGAVGQEKVNRTGFAGG